MTLQSILASIQFGPGTITVSHPSIPGLSITASTTTNTQNEIQGGLAMLALIFSMFHHASTVVAPAAKPV